MKLRMHGLPLRGEATGGVHVVRARPYGRRPGGSILSSPTKVANFFYRQFFTAAEAVLVYLF